MQHFNITRLGASVATLCLGLMTTVTSLDAKCKCFSASDPVRVNPKHDYLYPIRDSFYSALETGTGGQSSFVNSEFNDNNEVWFNTWFSGLLRVNPKNPKNLVTLLGHDSVAFFSDPSGNFQYFAPGLDIQLAYSFNGGKSWKSTVIPVSTWQSPAGNLAQSATSYDLRFDPSGNLYLLGLAIQTVTNSSQQNILYWTSYLTQAAATPSNAQFPNEQISPLVIGTPSFFQDAGFAAVHVQTNTGGVDPNTLTPDYPGSTGNPAGIIFVVQSTDGGKNWSSPTIVDASQSPAFIFTGQGLSVTPGVLSVDSSGHLVLTSTRVDDLNTLFSYLYGATSSNGGATWSTQAGPDSINQSSPIYQMWNDTTFQSLVSLDANYFTSFPNAGQPYVSNGSIVTSRGTSILPMVREYALPLSLQFDDTPNTSLADRAVILSTDGGNTWNPNAVQVAPCVGSSNHNPHLTQADLELTGLIVVDDFLGTASAVSPKTKRFYVAWQGGNGLISSDPLTNQFYPTIQVSVSNDSGNTWSVPFSGSQTPIDFANLGASQSFNSNIAVTKDGYVGVLYTDYRNFKPSDPNSLVKTDVWLAIYKELSDATGGPYGNGLQFVQEVRLTPKSYNAANAIASPIAGLPGLAEFNLGANTGLDVHHNDFYVTFTQAGKTPNPALVTQNGTFNGLYEDTNNHSNAWFVHVKGPK